MNKEEKKYVKIFPRFTQKIFIHGNQKFWPSRIFFFCFFFSSSSIPFTFPSFSLSADYLFAVIIELRIVGNRRCVDVTFVPSPNLIQIRVPIWCRKYPLLRRECWIFLVNFYRLGGGCGLTRTFYHANDFLHTDAAATDLCCHLSLSLTLSRLLLPYFFGTFFSPIYLLLLFSSHSSAFAFIIDLKYTFPFGYVPFNRAVILTVMDDGAFRGMGERGFN